MPLMAATHFEYGNTRLRARRRSRLGAAQLADMVGVDVPGLFAALANTAMRAEAESALGRGGGSRRLHEAVRAHEARELEQLRGFYDGRARELVDLLLGRWDLQNLLVLLRGVLRGADEEQALLDIVPMGAFPGALAREIMRQHEPPAAIALIVSWGLPDAATARAVDTAFEAFERDADLARLEHAVSSAHMAHTEASLSRFGPEGQPLRTALTRRTEDVNVVALLRMRAALADHELDALPAAAAWLPGAALTPDRLDVALRQPGAAETAALLIERAPRLRDPLGAWVREGNVVATQRALDQRRLLDEIAGYRNADPMSIAVPIAYAAELELEARNVRVLAEGAALDLTADELQGQLLLPQARR